MTAVNGVHQADLSAESSMVGLTHLFSTMSKDFGDGVVRKALTGQLQVSGETRAALRKAVGSYVTVDGFRNSELAPPPLLQDPVAHWARQRDDLAGAVIKVWAESQQPLRERMDAYLRDRGLLNGTPDYSAHSISVVQPDPIWDEAIAGLAEENPDISKDDLVLMGIYISGRVSQAAEEEPEAMEDQSEPIGDRVESTGASPVSKELSEAFQRTLDMLDLLSPDSPDWEQGIREFVEAIGEIREKKQADATAVAELDAEVRAVAQRHADLLAFFEWDAEVKLNERPRPWKDMESARATIHKLADLLKEYAQVHSMAAVRSEEAERAPRRTEMQQQIDEALAALEALEVQSPALLPTATAQAEGAVEAVEAEAVVEPVQPLISEEELASLRAENERLAAANRSLASDNEALREKTNQMASELGESRNLAENWRVSYQESRRSQALMPVEPLPEFQSVEQALQLAQQKFSDRLNFQLIAKSDTGIPFDNPRQVWDALEWLATTYSDSKRGYDAKTGGSGETDLDLSLRQACGWHYTSGQSPVTMGQYREYYEIWLRGRKRELAEHIGTGNGYHRGTIRIAFLWDAEEKKPVVGYIGRHQRTDAS